MVPQEAGKHQLSPLSLLPAMTYTIFKSLITPDLRFPGLGPAGEELPCGSLSLS